MGKFNPYAQENMYRMDEEPPKMELNAYILEYKQTGDGYWFACFLHQFEREILNRWVYNRCEKYSQHSRFKDIKQEMITILLKGWTHTTLPSVPLFCNSPHEIWKMLSMIICVKMPESFCLLINIIKTCVRYRLFIIVTGIRFLVTKELKR